MNQKRNKFITQLADSIEARIERITGSSIISLHVATIHRYAFQAIEDSMRDMTDTELNQADAREIDESGDRCDAIFESYSRCIFKAEHVDPLQLGDVRHGAWVDGKIINF